MKFKKISMLTILPMLISTSLAHSNTGEIYGSNYMMGYGFLIMGFIILVLMAITIWLIKGDNKK